MTALTAPWSPDAETAVRTDVLTITSTVQAVHPSWPEPIPLDVESGSVVFDETWTPHVQADLTCALPTDQAVLDALDPRDLVRVQVTAGYVYPGGERDEHLLADLGLRTRPVKRGSQTTMQLGAASDEALVLDSGECVQEFYASPGWALPDMLAGRLPAALGYVPDLDLTGCPTDLVPVQFDPNTTHWNTIKGAVDTANGWLRDRGDRTWTCTPWPTDAGQPVHLLRTGTNGTITSSDVTLDREPWANVVAVVYEWTDTAGVPRSVTGWAWLTGDRAGITGPAGDPLPGMKLYRETRKGQASQIQADAAARAILTRRLRAARSASITARSAFWVRPGRTVTVRLPSGGGEQHLVSRVSFDLATGEMTVTTRQPDTTPIATGA